MRQYAQDHPDQVARVRDDVTFLNTQKAYADEINTDKNGKGFMKILRDISSDIREKKPTAPTATSEAMKTIQANLADKPQREVSLDDIVNGVMVVLDSKVKLELGPSRMIERFVRWFFRTFGGKRKNNPNIRFQAFQELDEESEQEEKNNG